MQREQLARALWEAAKPVRGRRRQADWRLYSRPSRHAPCGAIAVPPQPPRPTAVRLAPRLPATRPWSACGLREKRACRYSFSLAASVPLRCSEELPRMARLGALCPPPAELAALSRSGRAPVRFLALNRGSRLPNAGRAPGVPPRTAAAGAAREAAGAALTLRCGPQAASYRRTAPLARPALCRAALRAASTRITPGRGPEGVDLNKLSFSEKLAFAWSVFFPAKEADHARNDAKKRLRMILVADRCALSPQSMNDMKAEIVRVVSEFVVVDAGEAVDVNMTNDEENGTIYSVAIPVKRIKPAVSAQPRCPCRARRALHACAFRP